MGSLSPIEYQHQRVLTTNHLATAYGTDEKRISENFINNKDRYIEGKHYYCLGGEQLKVFKEGIPQIADSLKYASMLYLWTEKGAWLHAKSLNTDQAWEAYEKLVDDYFRILSGGPVIEYHLPQTYTEALRLLADEVDRREQLQQQNQLMAPKVEMYDILLSADNAQTMNQVAKALGWGRNKLFAYLRDKKVLMGNNLPYQRFLDDDYFDVREVTTNRGDLKVNVTQTLVTAKGVDYIGKLLASRGNVLPMRQQQCSTI